MRSRLGIILVGGLGLVGCVASQSPGDIEEPIEEARLAQITNNGPQMNGISVNGVAANGVRNNGVRNNGVRNNGVRNNGTSLEGVDEDTGAVVTGLGHLGMTMTAELTDNTEITVYIDEIRTGEVSGMNTYVFKKDGANGINICINDASAIPLNGRWDYVTGAFIEDSTHLTIACRGAALAKCVELGYKRDGTNGATGVENRFYHEACVRMIRADYCGDGVSHTQNGTLIDIWDKAGLQDETSNSGMTFEAQWSPSGASCIKRTRWVVGYSGDTLDYLNNTAACAGRYVGPSDTTCGTSWGADLIRNATGLNDFPPEM